MAVVIQPNPKREKQVRCVGIAPFHSQGSVFVYFSNGSVVCVDKYGVTQQEYRPSRSARIPVITGMDANSADMNDYGHMTIRSAITTDSGQVNTMITAFKDSEDLLIRYRPGWRACERQMQIAPTCTFKEDDSTVIAVAYPGDRQISQRPGDTIAVGVFGTTSSSPPVVTTHGLPYEHRVSHLRYMKPMYSDLLAVAWCQESQTRSVDAYEPGGITLYHGIPGPGDSRFRLASASEVHTGRIIGMATGPSRLYAVTHPGDTVIRCMVSDNARPLSALFPPDIRTCRISQTEAGRTPSRVPGPAVVAVSSCERYFAVGCGSSTSGEVVVYDSESMEPLFMYETESGPSCLTFCSFENTYPSLYSGHQDGSVHRWRLSRQLLFHAGMTALKTTPVKAEPAVADHIPTDPLKRSIDL